MNNENNISRAELHLHTRFSKKYYSAIEVLKAIEKAKELNLSSIAFCDYKSVDAFPEIMNIKNDIAPDMKIIYGAELPFEPTAQIIKTAGYSLTILAKNKEGVKTIQELTNTLRPFKKGHICEILNLEILNKNRENLLIGSTGNIGEIFYETKWWWEFPKDYKKMAEFYDFFEIFPPRNHEDRKVIEMIIELSKAFHVPVVATSYALSLSASDEEERLQKMELHRQYHDGGNYILRSTDKLLKEFNFLSEEVARDVVLKNPKIIADRIQMY